MESKDLFVCDMCGKLAQSSQKHVVQAEVSELPSKATLQTYTRFFQICTKCLAAEKPKTKLAKTKKS